MKEKIIAILKKNHLHHYGDFDKAVEELNELMVNKHVEFICDGCNQKGSEYCAQVCKEDQK